MGNLGGGEILVILLVALLVLGPDKLPGAARQVGKAMGDLRRLTSGFQSEVRKAMEVDQPVITAAVVPDGRPVTIETATAEAPDATAAPTPAIDAAGTGPSTEPPVPAVEAGSTGSPASERRADDSVAAATPAVAESPVAPEPQAAPVSPVVAPPVTDPSGRPPVITLATRPRPPAPPLDATAGGDDELPAQS